ncbi:hypothetical protein [Aliihoeflea sp. PC F10.4]
MEASRTASAGNTRWYVPIWRLPAFVLLLFAVLAYGGLPSVPSHPIASISADAIDQTHTVPEQADECRNRLNCAAESRADASDSNPLILHASFEAEVDFGDDAAPSTQHGLLHRFELVGIYSSRAPPANLLSSVNPPPGKPT